MKSWQLLVSELTKLGSSCHVVGGYAFFAVLVVEYNNLIQNVALAPLLISILF